ncbi:hypothetical protein LTR49_027336 [Elasticomyces elasticus]|nr:hypothetical protein LTR49_027336 [Elasticomyces elasticus]
MGGSEFVHENCLMYIRNEADRDFGKGGFLELCRHLNIPEAATIRQISVQFESIKEKFTSVNADEEHITLRGVQVPCLLSGSGHSAAGQEPEHQEAMIIPGGFGRSVYLLNKISERYQGIRIVDTSQSHAALCNAIARSRLAAFRTESFGIGQVDVYDEAIHLDAVNQPTPKAANPNFETSPNMLIVERDPFMRGLLNVHDRWIPIIRKVRTM